MKTFKLSLSAIFLCLILNQTSAQNYLSIWTIGNANLIPRQQILFNSTFTTRYNLNGYIQPASNLLLLPIAPNAQIKILWWNKQHSTRANKFYSSWRFKLTTVHTFAIPTMAFRLNEKYNLVKLPYTNFPFNITMEHDLYLTIPLVKKTHKTCGTSNFLTLKAGWRHTFFSDTTLPDPNQGFWIIQTNSFKRANLYCLSARFDGKISNNLNLATALTFYDLTEKIYALENQTWLYFGFGVKKNSTIALGLFSGYIGSLKKFYFKPAFNYSLKIKLTSKRKSDIYGL